MKETNLLTLSSCNMNQTTTKGVSSEWSVRENITEEVLHTFPNTVSDKLMFDIVNFARKYELEAFNTGIAFAKREQNALLIDKIKELENHIAALTYHNDTLADLMESKTHGIN